MAAESQEKFTDELLQDVQGERYRSVIFDYLRQSRR